jgi:hypothetical protein
MKKLIQVTDMGDNYMDVNMQWPGCDLDKKNSLIILSSAYGGPANGYSQGESELYCTKIKIVR